MRTLSRAEGIVVQELLAGRTTSALSSDAPRLPRRTEQTVRQRVLARDWVVRRYLPDPAALGVPILSFVLARPFTERARSLADLWTATPACVLVWESPERTFGVFLAGSPPEAHRLVSAATPASMVHESSVLEVDTRTGAVPVYFDFEAGWTKFAGLAGSQAYPKSLPADLPAEGALDRPLPTPAERAAIARLLHRPYTESVAAARGARRLFLARAERRALAAGWVEPRCILDPVAIHRWAAGFPDGVALLQGDLREGAHPSELFRDLVEQCGIGPFLFATGSGRVWLGTLSRLHVLRETRPPATDRNVLSTLRRHLVNIRVDRIPLASITAPKQQMFVELLPDLNVPTTRS